MLVCCSHLLDELFILFSVSLLLVVLLTLILEPVSCIGVVFERILGDKYHLNFLYLE